MTECGGRLSAFKSPSLRKCRNPECDYYYYGDKRDRYCCLRCRTRATNVKHREARRIWQKEYYRKMMKDPNWRKNYNEKQLANRAKRMEDPEYRKKYLERQKQYYKERKERRNHESR